MKILNLNFSNKENNKIKLLSSNNSTTSIKLLNNQQTNLDNISINSDKLKILFRKVNEIESAIDRDKTNCNSKSTKNLPLETTRLKISDFETILPNSNDLNRRNVHHTPADSMDNSQLKYNSLSNFHRISTVEEFSNNSSYVQSYNLGHDVRGKIREFQKKHSNNLILMKKSQTKYKGKQAYLNNMTKYAFLSNYDRNFEFTDESKKNKDEVNESENKPELVRKGKSKYRISRSIGKEMQSCAEGYNSNQYEDVNRNDNVNEELKTEQNAGAAVLSIDGEKKGPKFSRINELQEQTENIKSKEEYYSRLQELSKFKPSNQDSSNFTQVKKVDMVGKKNTIRKSAFDFIMSATAEQTARQSEYSQDLRDLGLLNIKKRSSRLSIRYSINNLTGLGFEDSLAKNSSLFLRRRSSTIKDGRASILNLTKLRQSVKSSLVIQEHPVAKGVSLKENNIKSYERDFDTNTQLLLDSADRSPDLNTKKSYSQGVNQSPLRFSTLNIENVIKKPTRPLNLKVESVPLGKQSQRFSQRYSSTLNILDRDYKDTIDKNKTQPSSSYKLNTLHSSYIKIPNIPLPKQDLLAKLEASKFRKDPLKEKHRTPPIVFSSPSLAFLTEYEKDLIKKIKLIKKFVNEQPSDAFKSVKPNFRKIYVLQDGGTILKDLKFNGRFVDIPTTKYLRKHSSHFHRYESYIKFLEEASREFNVYPRFTHIFTLNGNQIFDLYDLHEEENSCYVSRNSNFRGIHLFSNTVTSGFKLGKSDLENFYQEDRDFINGKNRHVKKLFFPFSKQTHNTQLMRLSLFRKIKEETKFVEPIERNSYNDGEHDLEDEGLEEFANSEMRLLSKSFTCDSKINYTSVREDYAYLSESEQKKEIASKKLSKYRDNLFDLFIYFSEVNQAKTSLKPRQSCSNKLVEQDVSMLIQNYNKERLKNLTNKYSKLIKPKKSKKNRNYLTNTAAILIKKFLEHLNILRLAEDPKTAYYDLNRANPDKNKFIKINRKHVENIYFKIDYDVEKFLPDLVALNIPRISNEFPSVSRIYLYQIFIQYKTYLKISIAVNNSIEIMRKGIDFETFFSTIPNMKIYGREMALDLFKKMNERKTGFLEWDEYLKGMLMLRDRKTKIEESYVENNGFKWD